MQKCVFPSFTRDEVFCLSQKRQNSSNLKLNSSVFYKVFKYRRKQKQYLKCVGLCLQRYLQGGGPVVAATLQQVKKEHSTH